MAHFKLIIEGIQVPPGEAYGYTEGANGELGFYVVERRQRPAVQVPLPRAGLPHPLGRCPA